MTRASNPPSTAAVAIRLVRKPFGGGVGVGDEVEEVVDC